MADSVTLEPGQLLDSYNCMGAARSNSRDIRGDQDPHIGF